MNPEQNGGQIPPTQNPQQPPVPNPTPTANPAGYNYDFILNPEKPTKPKVPLAGSSTLQRVLIVVGILTVVIILGAIVSSVLSAGSKEKTQGLLTVAQEQTEIIRIATDGTLHTTSVPAQGLAQNVQASITSDNVALIEYIKNNGQKVTKAQLGLKHSKTTDTSLATALGNNTYDTTFKDVIQTELTDYMVALQKVYKTNPSPKGKALLSKQYDAATLLKTASEQK